MRLKLECTIWWWQFGWRDAWSAELTDKFGWPVKSESMQEEIFAWMCVFSWINWVKPFEDVRENKFNPFVVALISLDHQEEHLELKSPVTTDKDGLRLFMSFKSFWKLDENVKFIIILTRGANCWLNISTIYLFNSSNFFSIFLVNIWLGTVT